MANPVQIEVIVNYSKDYERLLNMLTKVNELSELVPEWSQYEADKLTDEILELAKDSLNTKVTQ